jgi:MYXO-CTERM domain-containing protein
VTIRNCFMTNLGTATPISDLGTFRHELGHSVFLWPDTYDYDNDSESGGGFATETDLPCAPFRMWSGWITPTNVTSSTGIYTLDANGSSFLRYNNASDKKEYFIAEYAKDATWRNPPDEGLLVWHIDEDGDNSWQDMTASRHYAMSVEQADGAYHLEKNVAAGGGDLFHSGDKNKFDGTTTPNSNWWNGTASGFKLCDIGAITGDTMNVNVGCVAAGGSSGTGGATSAGGTTAKGGATSAGGTTAKGGATSAGGTTAKGGATSAGGTTAKGGTSASSTAGTAGLAAIGGSAATTSMTGVVGSVGGAVAAVGGAAATVGGAVATVGGAVATVGGAATTVVIGDDSGDEGGCSCRAASNPNDPRSVTFLGGLAALALGLRRRWRS